MIWNPILNTGFNIQAQLAKPGIWNADILCSKLEKLTVNVKGIGLSYDAWKFIWEIILL